MVKRVLALGGDGIGPEVIGATVFILNGMGISALEIERELVGEEAIKKETNAASTIHVEPRTELEEHNHR